MVVDGGVVGEECEGIVDVCGEEVGDGVVVLCDGEDFGFEVVVFVYRIWDEDVGEELYFDVFVVEVLVVIIVFVVVVEGEI